MRASTQIRAGFFNRCSFARDIQLGAKCDVAIVFAFNDGSQTTGLWHDPTFTTAAVRLPAYHDRGRHENDEQSFHLCYSGSFLHMTTATHLECAICAKRYAAGQLHNLCECGGPLLVRYDLEKAKRAGIATGFPNGPSSMWRYAPVLPVSKPAAIVSLGEGMTPLIHTKRLGARLGASDVWVKDEGINPTGSFKARGLSCAISMCVELGVKRVAIPSAGNAAGAMAAYAAAAGIEAHIFMPRDVPQANYIECCAAGAKVTLVDGLISDCGKMVAARKDAEGWFEISHP